MLLHEIVPSIFLASPFAGCVHFLLSCGETWQSVAGNQKSYLSSLPEDQIDWSWCHCEQHHFVPPPPQPLNTHVHMHTCRYTASCVCLLFTHYCSLQRGASPYLPVTHWTEVSAQLGWLHGTPLMWAKWFWWLTVLPLHPPSPPLRHGFSDAANTNLSILGDSRKTSINEVSFAHDDISLEKAIPETVNEEDEIKGEESKL